MPQQHTAEPWRATARGFEVPRAGNPPMTVDLQSSGNDFGFGEERENIAGRIVACVNACAGMASDGLEAGSLRRLYDSADAACEYIESLGQITEAPPDSDCWTVLESIRAARRALSGAPVATTAQSLSAELTAALRRLRAAVVPYEDDPDVDTAKEAADSALANIGAAGIDAGRSLTADLNRLLRSVLPYAHTHAEDWSTGLEDGTYQDRDGLAALDRAVTEAQSLLDAISATEKFSVADEAPRAVILPMYLLSEEQIASLIGAARDCIDARHGGELAHVIAALTAEQEQRERPMRIAGPVDPWEEAARAAGWEHGGDNGGFWFDATCYESWKAAASWGGTHDNPLPRDTAREAVEWLHENGELEFAEAHSGLAAHGWRIATPGELSQGFLAFQNMQAPGDERPSLAAVRADPRPHLPGMA